MVLKLENRNVGGLASGPHAGTELGRERSSSKELRRSDNDGRMGGGLLEARRTVQVSGGLDAEPVRVADRSSGDLVEENEGLTVLRPMPWGGFLPGK